MDLDIDLFESHDRASCINSDCLESGKRVLPAVLKLLWVEQRYAHAHLVIVCLPYLSLPA